MLLVLAHHGDPLAARAHALLRARHGEGRARLLTAEDLAAGTRWSMWREGARVETRMRLADGAQLSSSEIGAVFNRLRFAAAPHFGAAPEADRAYALMETHAFLLSWLAALPCVVVNRASPHALGGDARGAARWLLLAGRAGLPTRGMRFATSSRRFPKQGYESHVPLDGAGLAGGAALKLTPKATLGDSPAHYLEPVAGERRRVVVVGSQLFGDELPPALREGCLSLARAAGCALAEFAFDRAAADGESGGGWRLCAANSFPADLGGDETEALVALLEAGGER